MDGGLDDPRALLLVERLEGGAPRAVVGLMDEGREGRQRLLAVAHDGHRDLHVLVHLALVDVQMDDLRLLGIGLQAACDAVAEAHTDGDEHVALLLFQVHGVVAVHPEHTHIQRVVAGQRTQPQHRAACGDIGFLQEGDELVLSVAEFHALPHQRQRPLGLVDQVGSLLHMVHLQLGIRHIGAHEIHFLRHERHHLRLGVLREVQHHGAGSAAARDVERTAHSPRDVLGMANLIAPLRDRLRHTHEIDLLEGICAKGCDGHLPRDDHDRRGVYHRVGNTRERIRGTRAAGDDGHAHLAADACEALGGVCGALFVAHEDMVKRLLLAPRVVIEGIIDGHDAAAGITEDGFHPLPLQRQHQRLAACNFFIHY